MQPPPEVRNRDGEYTQEAAPITVVQKDVLSIDTAVEDVPPRARMLQA